MIHDTLSLEQEIGWKLIILRTAAAILILFPLYFFRLPGTSLVFPPLALIVYLIL